MTTSNTQYFKHLPLSVHFAGTWQRMKTKALPGGRGEPQRPTEENSGLQMVAVPARDLVKPACLSPDLPIQHSAYQARVQSLSQSLMRSCCPGQQAPLLCAQGWGYHGEHLLAARPPSQQGSAGVSAGLRPLTGQGHPGLPGKTSSRWSTHLGAEIPCDSWGTLPGWPLGRGCQRLKIEAILQE